MAITIASIDQVDFMFTRYRVEMTLTTSGNYPSGGDIIDFTANGVNIPTEYPPNETYFSEVVATPATLDSGYAYIFHPGTTLANGRLQLFNGTSEHSVSGYPTTSLKAVFYFPNL